MLVLGRLLKKRNNRGKPFPCMQRDRVEPRTFWLGGVTLTTAPGLSFLGRLLVLGSLFLGVKSGVIYWLVPKHYKGRPCI